MSGSTILISLVALAAAVAGIPAFTRDEGVPGGELGAVECRKATIEVWHLPYPGDCTKFIKCDIIGNLSTIYTCDSPLHFNTKIQTCDWPESAGCTGGSGSTSKPTTPKPTTTTSGCGGGHKSSESSDSSDCKDSSDSSNCHDSSSSSGSHSCQHSSSDSEEDSKCDCDCNHSGDGGDGGDGGNSGQNDICKDATEHRYHLPHPTDPTKFYKCELTTGIAHLFDCPAGLVFKPDIQVCDWP